MRWGVVLRVGFVLVTALVFVGASLGILLTGPIVTPNMHELRLDVGASPDRLREAVRKLCTEFSPRSHRHTENLDLAAEWIATELAAAGLEVELQEYRTSRGRYRNVVGRRTGSDPSARTIVVGAHYDAYGEFPGADDNASGVAVLLELARTFPDRQASRTHLLVAFSTEEPPHFGTHEMGSHVFARRLIDDGTDVELMIALDLVGYFSDEPGSQRFPFKGLGLLYPDEGNFIAVVGDLKAGPWIDQVKRGMMATRALPVHSFRAPEAWAPVGLSDHRSFRRLGLPGVQVTDTAFMRFPHYHTADDTPEKLDYERMALLVEALHGVLWEESPN